MFLDCVWITISQGNICFRFTNLAILFFLSSIHMESCMVFILPPYDYGGSLDHKATTEDVVFWTVGTWSVFFFARGNLFLLPNFGYKVTEVRIHLIHWFIGSVIFVRGVYKFHHCFQMQVGLPYLHIPFTRYIPTNKMFRHHFTLDTKIFE